jgi:hypothetical protein
MHSIGLFSGESDLRRSRYSPLSSYPSQCHHAGHFNANFSQTVKGVRARQGALVDIFERMESFLRRLEIYTSESVQPNDQMLDTITTIMVEVLRILGIATKEIRQSRLSKCLP